MAFTADSLNYVVDTIVGSLGSAENTRMLELGDQTINDRRVREITAKKYFTRRGVDHTSFDLNGRHGSVKVDLSIPCDKAEYHNDFDVVTNFGTTEHVEPLETQYHCFANIHRWTKPGGIIIHSVPSAEDLSESGKWRHHCQYFYSRNFFEKLAEAASYEIIDRQIKDGLHYCVFQKADSEFPVNKDDFLSWITVDNSEGTTSYSGINDHGADGSVLRTVWRELMDRTRPWRNRVGLHRKTRQ
jgi:SAM-dependent methyltransferase